VSDFRGDSDLILFGSGGHAKVVLEAIRASNPSRNVIILDDDTAASERTVLGIEVTGTRQWLLSNAAETRVALGIGDNRGRADLLQWLSAHGRQTETVIHPSAIVGATAEIGAGAFLAAGSIIIADATIGAGAIVNTGASVDHDCVVGMAAHLGPGVRLCGNVHVGALALLGVGTAVRPGIIIGAEVVVGAGSAVVCNLAAGRTYAGCPARPTES
jgi:sugar O-acyltransferase (sialic acid O-acetyltransferase NeuD family)